MDDKDEKKGTGSNLNALLERMPVMNGGGRRRLTAGTIVVLTTIVVLDPLRAGIATAILNKDVSLSLILAGAALFIYATGVLVELVGEVFLARAVSNAVWSVVGAPNLIANWRPLYRNLAGLLIPVWGPVVGIAYFLAGLFGQSKWRMRLGRRLSVGARQTFEAQPIALKDAIEQALGVKAEFGRKALIDQLRDPESRRWARGLMERPKDILALVSAMVVSLFVYLSTVPYTYTVSQPALAYLAQSRSSLEDIEKALIALRDAPDMELLRRLPDAKSSQDPVVLLAALFQNWAFALGRLDYLASPSVLETLHTAGHIDLAFGGVVDDENLYTNINLAFERGATFCGLNLEAMKGVGLNKNDPDYVAISTLFTRMEPVCNKLSNARDSISSAVSAVNQEILDEYVKQTFFRITAVFGVLFLYVAFFNTFTASTVSVLELLALQDKAAPYLMQGG